jgi:hypothetical protein
VQVGVIRFQWLPLPAYIKTGTADLQIVIMYQEAGTVISQKLNSVALVCK